MLEIIKDEDLKELSNALITLKTSSQYFEKYGSIAINYNGPTNQEFTDVCNLLHKYCDKSFDSIEKLKELFPKQV